MHMKFHERVTDLCGNLEPILTETSQMMDLVGVELISRNVGSEEVCIDIPLTVFQVLVRALECCHAELVFAKEASEGLDLDARMYQKGNREEDSL